MRRILTVVALILAVRALPVHGAESVPEAYARLKPAIVRVWVFNAKGVPIKAGSGVIVATTRQTSTLLTSNHVVEDGASVRVDVSRELHDLRAVVTATHKGIDLALLQVAVGGLPTATFAGRSTVEGATVGAAGYGGTVSDADIKAGLPQTPQLLFPGTVRALLYDARIIEISNVTIEPGMSGGPVFDPATGQVLGIIEARLPQKVGVALSGPFVALAFLAAKHVPVAASPNIYAPASPKRVAVQTPAPRPAPTEARPLPTPRPPTPPVSESTPQAEGHEATTSGCSRPSIANVSGEGDLVATSDGASYRISNSYMEFKASQWITGDRVTVCTTRLANGMSASSIDNPTRDFKVQAVRVGSWSPPASTLNCSPHSLVRVLGDGSGVTTSDGSSYSISNSYMEFKASQWTTGENVNVCLTRLGDGSVAASIANPREDFTVQAQLAARGSSASIACHASKVFQVSGDGSTVITTDGVSYSVSNSYMEFKAASWTMGDTVTICNSRLGDGSVSASINNRAQDFTVEAIRR